VIYKRFFREEIEQIEEHLDQAARGNKIRQNVQAAYRILREADPELGDELDQDLWDALHEVFDHEYQ
jgi:polyphosphate kinase